MKLGDLVKLLDGRIGFVEWKNENCTNGYIVVIIPETGDEIWQDSEKLEVISESG